MYKEVCESSNFREFPRRFLTRGSSRTVESCGVTPPKVGVAKAELDTCLYWRPLTTFAVGTKI